MPVSPETYEQVVLDDPSGGWELYSGELRQRPGMPMEHNSVQIELAFMLYRQLEQDTFHLRVGGSRLEVSDSTFLVPDLFVLPKKFMMLRLGQPDRMERYHEALPLVVEVWSRSTGEYDVVSKLPEYRARGDLEIWLVHPYDHTITAWRRQPDGSYAESFHDSGVIEPASLPGVRIELKELFEF